MKFWTNTIYKTDNLFHFSGVHLIILSKREKKNVLSDYVILLFFKLRIEVQSGSRCKISQNCSPYFQNYAYISVMIKLLTNIFSWTTMCYNFITVHTMLINCLSCISLLLQCTHSISFCLTIIHFFSLITNSPIQLCCKQTTKFISPLILMCSVSATTLGTIEVNPVSDLEQVRKLINKLQEESGGQSPPVKISPDWCFVDCK